jgi:cytochrome oxidase Cu insertion factor (SCO1/SenC/PrrC family)
MKPKYIYAALTVCWLLPALVSIASAAEPAAPEKTGLAVGQKAPAFSLKDQHSREVSLDSLLKKGPVALVFYRSADW